MDARAERKIDMAIKINLDVVMAQRKTGLTGAGGAGRSDTCKPVHLKKQQGEGNPFFHP